MIIPIFQSKTQRAWDTPIVSTVGIFIKAYIHTSGKWNNNNPGYSYQSKHGDFIETLRSGALEKGGNTSSTFQRLRRVGSIYGWWTVCKQQYGEWGVGVGDTWSGGFLHCYQKHCFGKWSTVVRKQSVLRNNAWGKWRIAGNLCGSHGDAEIADDHMYLCKMHVRNQ